MKTSDSSGKPAGGSGDAADWAIRRAVGLTGAEETELRCWLESDSDHVAALEEAEKTVGLIRRPREIGAAGVVLRELRGRQQARRQRRRVTAGAVVGLAAVAAVAFLPDFSAKQSAGPAAPITVVVRPDRRTLPDGSVVQLNAGAEIRVEFTPGWRRVELVRGEALFSITSDAARPFVVTASAVEVRAVGTKFSVRHAATDVDVLVTEGRVAVARTGPSLAAAGAASAPIGSHEPIYVGAGSRVSLPVDGTLATWIPIRRVSPAEIAGALAWRANRIEFTGTSLGEAVALFNDGGVTQVALAEPSLATLRISGIFWKDDPEAFARLIEMSLGLVVECPTPHRIVLRRSR